MLTSFARQSYVRRRYPLDADGDVDFTATPDELTVSGVSIQPGANTEVLDGREAERIAFTVYQRPGHDVTGWDFAFYQGDLYRVAGEPSRWPGVTAATAHDVVLFERWEG